MNNGDISGDQTGKDALSDALSTYRRITSRFDSGAKASVSTQVGVELPLLDILKLIPDKYLGQNRAGTAGKTAFIPIPNLLEQLRKGKVVLPMHELAACIPAAMLEAQAFEDKSVVALPLASVVNAMDSSLLEQGDTAKEKDYDLANLPDPFRKAESGLPEEVRAPSEQVVPELAPVPEAPVIPELPIEQPSPPVHVDVEPVHTTEQVPVKPVDNSAAIPPMPEPEPESLETAPIHIDMAPPLPTVEEIEAETENKELQPPSEPIIATITPHASASEETLPGPAVEVAAERVEEIEEPWIEALAPPAGVNVNSATVEQLVTVEGLALVVAKKIVEYRQANGPFKSIFSLCDVPGVTKKLFKIVTGMPYSAKRHHRGRKLVRLLNIPMSKISHMPSIAQAVGMIPGISGCVISDKEGLVITASQAGSLAEAIGAVAHEITSHMRKSMEMTGAQGVDSVSISIKRQMFTLICSGEIYITVVHDSYRITGAKLALICNVAAELEWVLSRRLYIGA
jgi:competence ComEA-like helix-hairpin-helix protein